MGAGFVGGGMREYLSIYFPQWSIDLARRKLCVKDSFAANRPILLVSKVSNQLTIIRACKTAQKIGARSGMSLALAKALAPNAYVEAYNPIRDIRALYKIAVWAINISPLVSLRSARSSKNSNARQDIIDEGLIIDISGTERLYGNRTRLLEKLLHKFDSIGLEATEAIAPTIGAAWALSRFGHKKTSIVSWPEIKPTLAGLPIAALRIPTEALQALRDIGVVSIDQLTKLPRKKLPSRYGIEVLRRLDQAFGAVDEPFRAIKIRAAPQCRRAFEIPLTSQESVRRVMMLLFKELLARLQAHQLQAPSFVIEFQIINSDREISTSTKELSLYSATKDFSYLSTVIGPVIESIRASGGVRSISVRATKTEQFNSQQGDFFNSNRKNLDFDINQLFDHFTARLGPQRIRQVQFENSYIPERSFSYYPKPSRGAGRDASRPVIPVNADRPSYFFGKPKPISAIALLPDKPPSSLNWNGKQLKIISAIGPERICAEWWNCPGAARDYFKVQDSEGRWIWVFRDQITLKWFVHGLWL